MTDVQLSGLEALERAKPVSHDVTGGDWIHTPSCIAAKQTKHSTTSATQKYNFSLNIQDPGILCIKLLFKLN